MKNNKNNLVFAFSFLNIYLWVLAYRWLHGYIVGLLHGYMVTWLHGYIVRLLHGYMVI